MGIIFWLVILAVSIFVLVRSSDLFIEKTKALGALAGISPFIIGVTLVSIGTSLPELLTSLLAVHQQASEIVLGNVLGSNIANLLFVAGIAGLIAKKITVQWQLIKVDLPLLITTSALLGFMLLDGDFSFGEAVLCFLALVFYLWYALQPKRVSGVIEEKGSVFSLIWGVFLSALLLYLSAKYTIVAIIQLSSLLHFAKEVLAASAVALGTSLPELMVSITATRKGDGALVFGNIIGSNIFNALAITAIPRFLAPLTINPSFLFFNLGMMFTATLIFVFMTQENELTRWEGGFLVIFYLFYLGKLYGFL